MAETETKESRSKAILDMGTPGGVMGTLIPGDEEEVEIPFAGMSTGGETGSTPAVWSFGGRHWQQGDKAPASIVALIEKRARQVYPDQFAKAEGSEPVENLSAVPSGAAVSALTAATGNEEQARAILEARTSEEETSEMDSPAATQSVAEGSGGVATVTPGAMPTGSLPQEEEEEEESETSNRSGARRRRS
jgi:hypothetical protein